MLEPGQSGGDRRRTRAVTAACASCLAVGVSIGGLVGTQSVAGNAGGPIARAADIQTVFGQFTRLDRQLTRAIDRAEKGESVESLISQIRDGKFAIVDQQMGAPIDGVKGSEWFRDLDCADRELDLAQGAQSGVPGHHAKKFTAMFLEHAKRCKQTLENDLHKANETGGTTIGTTIGTPTVSGP